MITLAQAKSNGTIYHKQGFTCAQSVIRAFAEYKNLDVDQLMAATTVFGSGINSGCICGSLAAAEMLIGVTTAHNNKLAREKSKLVHDRFRERFGATCCRVIRGKENGICAKTIEEAISMLDDISKI